MVYLCGVEIMKSKMTQMKYSLTTESRVNSIDFNNLPFGAICSDHMLVMDYEQGAWKEPEIVPLGYFPTHPANLAWHYGQSIFEGMKASKHQDGTPMLFRVDMHAKRMNASAERMCMPHIPEELFTDCVKAIVKTEQQWIPPAEGSALYIRPLMYATEEFIGVKSSSKFRFVIFTCPVGPYYAKPVSLYAETKYVRACGGGVGEAKTAGNYAASLYPAKLAQAKGFDQVMWLDPYKFKYIQEVGTMNIFFIIKNKAYTPDLNGSILKGITRDSIIQLLNLQKIKVVEKRLSIQKVLKAHKKKELKEVFGAGTAAVVSTVGKIAYKKKEIELDTEKFEIAPQLKQYIDELRVGKREDLFGWTSRIE